ncbi:MAG: hypothetical protein MZV70_07660 [Desulfobacterales bacterium]|nr:hypothetical protein [Desulfobacterales bacterium]
MLRLTRRSPATWRTVGKGAPSRRSPRCDQGLHSVYDPVDKWAVCRWRRP